MAGDIAYCFATSIKPLWQCEKTLPSVFSMECFWRIATLDSGADGLGD